MPASFFFSSFLKPSSLVVCCRSSSLHHQSLPRAGHRTILTIPYIRSTQFSFEIIIRYVPESQDSNHFTTHLIMRASLSVFVTLLFASSACARVIPAWMMKDPPVSLNTRDIEDSTIIRHAPESSFERRIDDRLE